MFSTEGSTKKRRARVALRPKANSVELGQMSSSPFGNDFATVPRIMRSRIAKAARPARPRKQENEASKPEQSNQRIARSNSGKVALGPWTGAFGSEESLSSDETILYIDPSGSMHKDLKEEEEVIKKTASKAVVAKQHRRGTVLDTTPLGMTPIPPPDEKTRRLHSREVETLQQKPIVAYWGKSACGKQACKGRATTRVGFINQPKRGI